MKLILAPLKRIFLQILLLLLCYFLCRAAFTLSNLNYFSGLTVGKFLELSFYGLRFDLSTIVIINGLYFFLLLFPFPIWKLPVYTRILQFWFILSNALALAFEVSDWAYFPFTQKRATNDVLDMIGRKSDFLNLLPHFIKDYWYAPLGFVILILFLSFANRWICKKTPLNMPAGWSWKVLALKTFSLILCMGISLIAMRGGFQLIPIGNGNALKVTENKFVPVVLNTPFSISHSYSGQLEEVRFYPQEQALQYINPEKKYFSEHFKNKNVVVLILESFSREYTGLGGRKSFTPFLDSLMKQSLVFTNAFANGLTSAAGIPAILSGIPSLLDEPFTTSAYGTNKLTSIPQLLKDKGYQTAFYHGGTNGTMSFDIYASNAGFEQYFGRKEYNNEADFDGNWGIWDEPFLQYFARGLGKMKQPFMASVFTLSSHDPFKIPRAYQGILPEGPLPVQQSIAYTDLALRKFFQTASQQPWFENTVFVLTADHCSPISKDSFYSSAMGRYTIPIIFFAPGDSTLRGSNEILTQQIDILPSLMNYLGYEQHFYALGNSAFSNDQPRFVINQLSGNYQWLMNGFLLSSNEFEPAALYEFTKDSLCRKNILFEKRPFAEERIIPWFKAFIQVYRSGLINNRLYTDMKTPDKS